MGEISMSGRGVRRGREEDELAEEGEARAAAGPGREKYEGNGTEEIEAEDYESGGETGVESGNNSQDGTFVADSPVSEGQSLPGGSQGTNTQGTASGDENVVTGGTALAVPVAARPPDVRALIQRENAKWRATKTGGLLGLSEVALGEKADELLREFGESGLPENTPLKNGYQILAAGPVESNPHYQKTLYTMILCWLLDGLGHDEIYGSKVNRSLLLKVFLDAHPDLDLHYKTELKSHILTPKSDASAKAIIVSALKDLAVTLGIPMTAEIFAYDATAKDRLLALLGDGKIGVLSVDSLKGDYKNVLRSVPDRRLYFGKSAAVLGDPASFNPETAASGYGGSIGVVTQGGPHVASGATGMPMSVRTTMTLLDDTKVQKLIELAGGETIKATFTNKGVSITQVQKLAEFLISGVREDFIADGNIISSVDGTLVIELSKPKSQFSTYELVAVCVGLKTDGDFGIGRNMADLPGSPVTYTLAGGRAVDPAEYTDVHMSIDIIASIFGKVFASKIGFLMNSTNLELFSGVAVQSGITVDRVSALLRNIQGKVSESLRYTASTAVDRTNKPEEAKAVAAMEMLDTIAKSNKSKQEVNRLIYEIGRNVRELIEGSRVKAFLQELVDRYNTLQEEVTDGESNRTWVGLAHKRKEDVEELARTFLQEKYDEFTEFQKILNRYEAELVRYALTELGSQRLTEATTQANTDIRSIFDEIGGRGSNTELIREVLKLYHAKIAELNANENLRSGQRFIDPVGMLTAESFSELAALYEPSGTALKKALADLDEGGMKSHAELLRNHSRNIDGDHEARFMMRNLTNLFVKFGFTKLVSSQVAGYLAALLTGPLFRTGTEPERVEDIPEDKALQSDDESVPDQNYANFQRLYGEAIAEVSGNKDLATGKIINIVITLLTGGKVPDLEGRLPPLAAAAEAAPGGGAGGVVRPAPPVYPPSIPYAAVEVENGEFREGGAANPDYMFDSVKYIDGIPRGIYRYQRRRYILTPGEGGTYMREPLRRGGSRKYKNRKTYKKAKKSKRATNKKARKST